MTKNSKINKNEFQHLLSCSTVTTRETQTAKIQNRYLNLLIDFYTHCFLKTMIAVNTSFEIKKKKKKKGRNRKLIINQRTILLQQSQNERNFPRNFIMSAYIN